MRTGLIALVAMMVICGAAIAEVEPVELYNVGVSVSTEGDEQTIITLWLDGDIQPARVEGAGENILVYDLPDVELTAANEGVTSVAVFSPSVASIKLTQIGKEPFVTRLEIYTNGARDVTIEKVDAGYDFIVYAKGGTPVLTKPAEEEVEATPAEEVGVAAEEKPVEEGVASAEAVTEPAEEEAIQEPEESPIEEPIEEPEEETIEEAEEEGGINLLEGINLLQPKEEPTKPAVAPKDEAPPPKPYVAPADFVKLESLNYQAGEGDVDSLVFTLAGIYKGDVKTNFMHKKGFIVLTSCDVGGFVKLGEFKTVKLAGKHLKSVVVNINPNGEAVFSLILRKPDAKYELVYEISDNVVRVDIKPAK